MKVQPRRSGQFRAGWLCATANTMFPRYRYTRKVCCPTSTRDGWRTLPKSDVGGVDKSHGRRTVRRPSTELPRNLYNVFTYRIRNTMRVFTVYSLQSAVCSLLFQHSDALCLQRGGNGIGTVTRAVLVSDGVVEGLASMARTRFGGRSTSATLWGLLTARW